MCKETTEGRSFDQIVKGNVSIKKVSEHRYKITFSKIGKFLVYQVWDKDSVDLNNKRAVDYVSAKKWVTAFKKSNEELEDGDEHLFTPTTIMETEENDIYAFVIHKAYLNSHDQVVFTVSTKEISLQNNTSKKLVRLPSGKCNNMRFDINNKLKEGPLTSSKFPVPTKLCDYNNSLIVAKAKEITEGSLTKKEQATRISLWVKENSEYHIGYGGYWDSSASESLNTINSFGGKIKGMCFNTTNVQIALLRALGINSRFAINHINSHYLKKKLPDEFAQRMDNNTTQHIFAEIWTGVVWERFDTLRDCNFNTRVNGFIKLNEKEDWEINDIAEKGIIHKKYLDNFAKIKAKRYTRIERDKMDDHFQNNHNNN
jgi:hypothetical protein